MCARSTLDWSQSEIFLVLIIKFLITVHFFLIIANIN